MIVKKEFSDQKMFCIYGGNKKLYLVQSGGTIGGDTWDLLEKLVHWIEDSLSSPCKLPINIREEESRIKIVKNWLLWNIK